MFRIGLEYPPPLVQYDRAMGLLAAYCSIYSWGYQVSYSANVRLWLASIRSQNAQCLSWSVSSRCGLCMWKRRSRVQSANGFSFISTYAHRRYHLIVVLKFMIEMRMCGDLRSFCTPDQVSFIRTLMKSWRVVQSFRETDFQKMVKEGSSLMLRRANPMVN